MPIFHESLKGQLGFRLQAVVGLLDWALLAGVEVEREVGAEPQGAEPHAAAAAREVAQEREAALVLSLSATDTACP